MRQVWGRSVVLLAMLAVPLGGLPSPSPAQAEPPELPTSFAAEDKPVRARATAAARTPAPSAAFLRAQERAADRARGSVFWPRTASGRVGGSSKRVKEIGPARVRAPRRSGRVAVKVLGRAATTRAGVAGVAIRVRTARRGSVAGKVRFVLDTKRYARLLGDDWATHVDVSRYPSCLLRTPRKARCQRAVAVASTSSTDRIVAKVPAARLAGSTQVLVFQTTAGAANDDGDFRSTPLAPSAEWTGGGSSGAFTWSYPLRMPPLVAGPEPQLSIGYSSQVVDGRTVGTNNQSTTVGEGFSLTESYIERGYIRCKDDGVAGKRDLCWKTDNAHLVLNGAAHELVEASDGTWRLAADDGSRVRRLTGGPGANPDNDKEYWELTASNGTRYYFGRTAIPGRSGNTASVWHVPVSGNNAGEPCHGSNFARSFCTQGWRWNLDYVVDTSGNAMSYWYGAEPNHYARNGDVSPGVRYIRGGRLKRIDYGFRAGETSATPPMRVTFGYKVRCLAKTGCGSYSKAKWPDVPFDQICVASKPCTGRTAPTFFGKNRLTTVTTSVRKGGSYDSVDRWSIAHKFLDPGGTYATVLWPTAITHQGLSGGTITLPKVSLEGALMINRVEDAKDGISGLARYRLRRIVSETGGVTTVNYSNPDCPATPPNPATNTRRCFPQRWNPPGDTKPRFDWFQKYVVTSVIESDNPGRNPDRITTYRYSGGGAWAYDDNPLVKPYYRTWSQWRGHRTVRTILGSGQDGPRGEQVVTYLRGMDGDRTGSGGQRSVTVTDSTGTAHTDAKPLAGYALETITKTHASGSEFSGTISTPWTRRTAGSGLHSAWFVAPAKVETREKVSTGGSRSRRVVTTYDPDTGQPTRVSDHGELGNNADQTCVATAYAGTTSTTGMWRIGFPSRQVLSRGLCGADALNPAEGNLLGASRIRYDGRGQGETPDRGLVTERDRAKGSEGGNLQYQLVEKAAYDPQGRPTTVTVPAGNGQMRTDTTSYTTSSDGTLTGVATTVDAGGKAQRTSRVLAPAWGATLSETDPNGNTQRASYDALGRLTAHWEANLTGDTPSEKYSYAISRTTPSKVTTREINTRGEFFVSQVDYVDSLLRPRQTQVPAANFSGRIVSSTSYDSRGLVSDTSANVYASGDAGSGFVEFVPGEIPTQTRFTHDGLSRVVTESLYSNNTFKWKTTHTYQGADKHTVTPPAGATPVTQRTDIRGQVVTSVEHGTPALHSTYDYDLRGNLVGLTTPGGEWTWDYDVRGRKTASTDPDAGTSTFSYTANDLLETSSDARGASVHRTYDVLDRPTRLYQSADAVAEKLHTSWTYDTVAKGHLTAVTRYLDGQDGPRITDEVKSYTRWYAPREKRLTLTPGDGDDDVLAPLPKTFDTTYGYYGNQAPDSLFLPGSGTLSGEGMSHDYDPQNRLNRIQGSSAIVQDINYTPHGEVDLAVLGRGHTRRIYLMNSYATATRRLTRQLVTTNDSQTVASDQRLTYDPAGNPTRIADTARHDVQCFDYDDHRRLAQAWTPTSGDCSAAPTTGLLGGPAPYWKSWSFNQRGLRASQTTHLPDGDVVDEYVYPAVGEEHQNALTRVERTLPDDTQVALDFGYDASGNTTSRPDDISSHTPAGQQTLTWDAQGKLQSLERPGDGGETRYVYGVDGNLLLRSGPGETVLFYQGLEARWDKQTQELSGVRHYEVPFNATVKRTGDDDISYLVTDLHGTPVVAIDGATQTATSRHSLPFGETRGTTPPQWPGGRGFLDKPTDETTGLTSVGARQYDPVVGRFLSVDPLLDPSSAAQSLGYGYANNNPVTFEDPSGLMMHHRDSPTIAGQAAIKQSWEKPRSDCGRFCFVSSGVKAMTSVVRDTPKQVTVATTVAMAESLMTTLPATRDVASAVGSGIATVAREGWGFMIGDAIGACTGGGEGSCPLEAALMVPALKPIKALKALHKGIQARRAARKAKKAAKAADDVVDLGKGWRATSFGDEAASFEYHFSKHGVAAGVTRQQYADDALRWARNPAGTGKPVQLKDGTEGLRYRTPGGGPGGILDNDGNIITYWYR